MHNLLQHATIAHVLVVPPQTLVASSFDLSLQSLFARDFVEGRHPYDSRGDSPKYNTTCDNGEQRILQRRRHGGFSQQGEVIDVITAADIAALAFDLTFSTLRIRCHVISTELNLMDILLEVEYGFGG